MRNWYCVVLTALLGAAAICLSLAQPTGAAVAPPPLEDVPQKFEQGITLTFSQYNITDARSTRLLALHVPAGASPTPFLKSGPFTARFTGVIVQRLRGEFAFAVEGRGKVAVKLKGQVVLEAEGDDFAAKASEMLKFDKGKNPIEVIYTSPASGDASLRLLWSNREFPFEPVQPTVLSHDVSDPNLRAAQRMREGRETFASLRCYKCHAAQGAGNSMPELEADAPNLGDAGARFKASWLAAWIANPRSLRPDASMPRKATAQEAADIAAWLAVQGKLAAASDLVDDESATQGSQLFAGLGCIACHTKPEVTEHDRENQRVPLGHVNAKFAPGALKAWLLNPQQHYSATRMPNFHLTDYEAARLVAYLSRNAKGETPANGAKGDPARGEKLFASLQCGNCHTMKDVTPRPAPALSDLVAKSDWKTGCVAAEDSARGNAPDFSLDDAQRTALTAFAAGGTHTLFNDVPAEFAERAVRQFQCVACHARDDVEDRWTALADEVADLMPPETNIENDQTEETAKGPRLFYPANLGRLHAGDRILVGGDQQRPTLTWAGEKLRFDWMAEFIYGATAYKPRYWLRARMPGFPSIAKKLAVGLAHEHGIQPSQEPLPAPKPELAAIGQKLVSRDGGFACITCHSIKDTRAISPFEAPAPNFVHLKDRLRYDFYLRWMGKPMRYQPGTKMPQFSENGTTTLKEIQDGDASKQFDAIWNYILQGEKMMAPE